VEELSSSEAVESVSIEGITASRVSWTTPSLLDEGSWPWTPVPGAGDGVILPAISLSGVKARGDVVDVDSDGAADAARRCRRVRVPCVRVSKCGLGLTILVILNCSGRVPEGTATNGGVVRLRVLRIGTKAKDLNKTVRVSRVIIKLRVARRDG